MQNDAMLYCVRAELRLLRPAAEPSAVALAALPVAASAAAVADAVSIAFSPAVRRQGPSVLPA